MGNAVETARAYRFEAFTLDVRTGEMTSSDGRTPLREQPLRLLLALVERPGQLVTREELTSRLWPSGVYIDFDRGLNKAINHLREALGDSAEQPYFIETLPRKGYRFIAPVTCTGEDVQAAPLTDRPRRLGARQWILPAVVLTAAIAVAIVAGIGGVRQRGSSPPRIAALAVLPLEQLSHDPEQQYFADGLTDALITDLAKMGSTRITSRTSVMRYKGTKKSVREIGRELNVD